MSQNLTQGYGAFPSTTDAPPPPNPTFVSRAAGTSRALSAAQRPWRELLDPSALSLPDGYADALDRIRRNFAHFRVNYAMVALLVIFLGLVYHPFSLIVFLILLLLWFFFYFSRDAAAPPIAFFGRPVDDRVVLVGLCLVTVVALVLTHVGTNVLVALIVGVAIVGLHAAFRAPDDLFLDEQAAAEGGLVSGVARRPLEGGYARI